MLESVRRRSRLPDLALADDRGMLLAGAGRHAVCEELSAASAQRRTPSAMALGSFELLGQTVLLCCSAPPNDPGLLSEIADACRRIVGRPKAATRRPKVGPLRAAL
jgi:hypothetical protein